MRDWEIDPEFVLKVTPPRTPQGLVRRDRLSFDRLGAAPGQFFLVEAPAGFGKTLLLTQWRRACLSQGIMVAWLSVDERDAGLRFVYGLGCAMHVTSGHRAFGQAFMHWLGQQEEVTKALTGWLAEVAELPVETVLMLDITERPPADLWDSLAYLVRNAPTNLRIVAATRSLSAGGPAQNLSCQARLRISARDLAFVIDETVAALRATLGVGFDAEIAVKLHSLTEGWPLGLQLAAAILRRNPELIAAVENISHSATDIRRYFMDTLVSQLSPKAFELIVRLSVFEYIHPELGQVVSENEEAASLLAQLRLDTPVIMDVENGPWFRMHPLAREFLLEYFNALPETERGQLSRRASEWFAAQGLFQDAAKHALLAGENDAAYGYVGRALREMYGQGQVSLVMEWFDRIPQSEIDSRPSLQFAAAWGLASGFRYAEAEVMVKRILSRPDLDMSQRFEAAMIAGAAASFSDRLDDCAAIVDPWQTVPKGVDPRVIRARLNHLAMIEMHRGHTEKARYHLMHMRSVGPMDLSFAFCDLSVSVSYLWEGKIGLAIQVARPALVQVERQMGRRSPIACMIASVLARALWEQDLGDDACLVLAHRLDVLEQAGLPYTILLAYITQARLAEDEGNEAKANSLLDGLFALGELRSLPRLGIAAVCELIRMHALRGRLETVTDLCCKLDQLVNEAEILRSGVLCDWTELHLERAHAYRALVGADWSSMTEHLARAGECAQRLRRHRDLTELRLLRAYAIERNGGDGSALYSESLSLASASGLVQVLRKTHPDITRVLHERFGYNAAPEEVATAKAVPSAPVNKPAAPPRSAILTAKEMEILLLIARGISNKEIAMSLDVGEETVKWHIKNLFRKLDVATRRQAVSRASMLGIIDFSISVS